MHDTGNRSVALDIKRQTSVSLFGLGELNFLKFLVRPSHHAFTQEEQQHFYQQLDVECRRPRYATHFAKTKLKIGSVAAHENSRLNKAA
jgi:hypothetical protein